MLDLLAEGLASLFERPVVALDTETRLAHTIARREAVEDRDAERNTYILTAIVLKLFAERLVVVGVVEMVVAVAVGSSERKRRHHIAASHLFGVTALFEVIFGSHDGRMGLYGIGEDCLGQRHIAKHGRSVEFDDRELIGIAIEVERLNEVETRNHLIALGFSERMFGHCDLSAGISHLRLWLATSFEQSLGLGKSIAIEGELLTLNLGQSSIIESIEIIACHCDSDVSLCLFEILGSSLERITVGLNLVGDTETSEDR